MGASKGLSALFCLDLVFNVTKLEAGAGGVWVCPNSACNSSACVTFLLLESGLSSEECGSITRERDLWSNKEKEGRGGGG